MNLLEDLRTLYRASEGELQPETVERLCSAARRGRAECTLSDLPPSEVYRLRAHGLQVETYQIGGATTATVKGWT